MRIGSARESCITYDNGADHATHDTANDGASVAAA